ncbi:hypothetical protein [Catenulispora subtropica]|uniref:Uncharacterized protein n=1 Tax=Catenulispora subtropica TaxID=450798 RepID=A0ABN2SRN3_9ACTN
MKHLLPRRGRDGLDGAPTPADDAWLSLVLSDLDAGDEPPLPGLIAPAMERGARRRRRRRASGAAAMTAGAAGVVLAAFGALAAVGGSGGSGVPSPRPGTAPPAGAGFERQPAPGVVAAVAAAAPDRTAIGQPARDPAAVRVELVWQSGLAEIQVHAARDGSGCPGPLPWAGTVAHCAATAGAGGRAWTFTAAAQDGSPAWGAAYLWPDGTRVVVVADYRDALDAHADAPPLSPTTLVALAADPRMRDAAL